MKKPLSGQYKVNLDTGEVYVVGSKAQSALTWRSRPACYSGVRIWRSLNGGKICLKFRRMVRYEAACCVPVCRFLDGAGDWLVPDRGGSRVDCLLVGVGLSAA
jgi:hypothetical protein